MKGGGLFETGAGGSAPKHVQQFTEENYLRWDSLGEFLAIAASLEHFADSTESPSAQILADALDEATSELLTNNKLPQRKIGKSDNRGSHFYLAFYWAQALAKQNEDPTLRATFSELSKKLIENEDKIVEELNSVRGKENDIGGYYFPDDKKANAAMRPSDTFNQILSSI